MDCSATGIAMLHTFLKKAQLCLIFSCYLKANTTSISTGDIHGITGKEAFYIQGEQQPVYSIFLSCRPPQQMLGWLQEKEVIWNGQWHTRDHWDQTCFFLEVGYLAAFLSVILTGADFYSAACTSERTSATGFRISPSRSTMAVRAGKYNETVEAPFSSTLTG